MADLSNNYDVISNVGIPRVTHEMVVTAARVMLGYAQDVDDARLLMEMFGFSTDVLEEARRTL